MSLISQSELQSCLSYDPNTGVFNKLAGQARKTAKNGTCGSKYSCGYVYIYVKAKRYLAHRLAWLYVHGHFPPHDLDHINGDRADNRISNLREATRSENMQNYKKPVTNTSGFLGARWRKRDQTWEAVINTGNKSVYLGRYNSAEDAGNAYKEAKKQLHIANPLTER